MPHCTYFICPIYKIRIDVSSGITPAPIHIYYNCISKICQSNLSVRLFCAPAEHQPEDGTGKRPAVQQLPAQGHGHIAAPCMHPSAKAGFFKQHRCDQAHHRAHDAHDHQRDGIGDELRPVGGAYEGEAIKRRVERKYNSRARPRQFRDGDLVMRKAHLYEMQNK